MNKKNRRAPPKGATRAEIIANSILDAALMVISRQGYGRMLMQDVGEAAKVSRATLYRHFPSKEELLAALAERRRREFAADLRAAIPDSTDPGQLLSALISFLETYYRHDEPSKFLEREPEFSIATFRSNFPLYMDIYNGVAGAELDLIAKNQDILPAPMIVELIVRLLISDVLIPSAPLPLFLTRLRPLLGAILGVRDGSDGGEKEEVVK